jgi:hypothetical protein
MKSIDRLAFQGIFHFSITHSSTIKAVISQRSEEISHALAVSNIRELNTLLR